MRPIATDVVRSVVCTSVCLHATTGEPIEMPFGGLTHVDSKNHWGSDSPRDAALLWGHVPAHFNLPTHECIAHCSPAAAGECACPAHDADECIRCGEW